MNDHFKRNFTFGFFWDSGGSPEHLLRKNVKNIVDKWIHDNDIVIIYILKLKKQMHLQLFLTN